MFLEIGLHTIMSYCTLSVVAKTADPKYSTGSSIPVSITDVAGFLTHTRALAGRLLRSACTNYIFLLISGRRIM